MRAVTFQGVESVAVQEVPDPAVEEGTDAVVRVVAAGLCGSDLHPYFGREVGLDVGTVMGHEFVGEVVEVGADVRRTELGALVVAPFTTSCGACFYCTNGLTARCERGQLFGWVEGGRGLHGGQAEFVRVPLADTTLVEVPDGLTPELAVLCGDILATALFGAELAGVSPGATVLVVGCGPVGLLAVRTALARGAARVCAADPVPGRRRQAERFGAVVVDADREAVRAAVEASTDGRGADCAIEAVGTPEATRLAADALRPGGRLAALGVHVEPHLALAPGEIYDRNLTYAGGRCPARSFLPQALELAMTDAPLISELITHRLPLSAAPEAYRRFGAREEGWGKVVFDPRQP